jgi:hypothetical protein
VGEAQDKVEEDLGLTFATEKTFVVASSYDLAKAVVTHALPFATPSRTVRRLGVDYSLPTRHSRAASAIPVYKARLKQAKIKSGRLRGFAPKGAPRIFTVGVLPSVLYGAEHFFVPPKDLDKLQKQSASCGAVRPMGVAAAFKMLAQPTANGRVFMARSAPVIRWAREVWIATGPAHLRPPDTLTGVELHQAATLAGGDRALPQGPLLALRESLNWCRWTCPKAHIMITSALTELDLTVGSPAMLRCYLKLASEAVAQEALNETRV